MDEEDYSVTLSSFKNIVKFFNDNITSLCRLLKIKTMNIAVQPNLDQTKEHC